jgi:3-methyladenine DNA glycosylase AlkC
MKLKDMYNDQYVADLTAAVRIEFPAFDGSSFAGQVFGDGWQERELKDRMRHITIVLHGLLPRNYRAALDVLRRAAPNLSQYSFENMVFCEFVGVYGLEDWEASIPALEEFTQLISAEFAVRPFIQKDRDRMMAQMLAWAYHDSAEVRRLASEGCRPRLPWGISLPSLKADPSPILPILEQLKLDESEAVRRSVANNLNDISKDNPEVVIAILQRWQALGCEEIDRITGHALRGLLRAGNPDALELLGYPPDPAIAVRHLKVEPETIPFGGMVIVSFDIESLGDQPQNLMIDYVMHYMKASGELRPKVWKLSKRTIRPGEVVQISKRHSFQAVTTRKHYPGAHAVEPKINGRLFGRVMFTVD